MASPRLPTVDFSGLERKHAGTAEWGAVRARVMQALELDGCFEATRSELTAELLDAVFDGAVAEALALPPEARSRCPAAFEAWTNGRLRAIRHRVVMRGDKTRKCTILSSFPRAGYVIQAPEELVDEDHVPRALQALPDRGLPGLYLPLSH